MHNIFVLTVICRLKMGVVCVSDTIPSRPTDLIGSLNDKGYIQLNWNPPKKNADMVQSYAIYYQSVSSGQQVQNIVSSTIWCFTLLSIICLTNNLRE